MWIPSPWGWLRRYTIHVLSNTRHGDPEGQLPFCRLTTGGLLHAEGHAGAHGMRHELAVAHDVALDERHSASAALDVPARFESTRPHGTQEVDLDLERRVRLALAERGHEGPTHCRVGDRGENSPCTVPMGLAWAGVGSSTTTASPGAKDSSRIPMSVAAGGAGISPRSMRSIPSSILAIALPLAD